MNLKGIQFEIIFCEILRFRKKSCNANKLVDITKVTISLLKILLWKLNDTFLKAVYIYVGQSYDYMNYL